MKLSSLAKSILNERYLLKNEKGEIIETPEQMFSRVSDEICKVDIRHYNQDECGLFKDQIFNAMVNLDFLPNSPTLMNAGTVIGQLSACFVLPVEDSIESIFNSVKHMASIHKSGGGTGFSFSSLRPKGDLIQSTMGASSGPLSFMNVFDATTSAITQGGRRRGANMGIMAINHPDIEDFIEVKIGKKKKLENFNLSVAITDEFMEKVENNEDFALINPRNQEIVKKVSSVDLFMKICKAAWTSGDPGLIFIDQINRDNPTPDLGMIQATNPCGEIPLYSYESCNLGSINLKNVIVNGGIDWDKLKGLTRMGVRFLDNVIDANKYPLPEIEIETKKNRKVGLGIMGFADLLIILGIRYDSNKALKIGNQIMKFINDEAMQMSIELGEEKGSFPNFSRSIYKNKVSAIRNASRTAIAPTGTISLIAGCSSGIEPIFSLYYKRQISGLGSIEYTHPLLVEKLNNEGYDVEKYIERVKNSKGINRNVLPEGIQELFLTAFEIPPEMHVRMQANFQQHVDNSVSKTINLPEYATIDDVNDAFKLAFKLKCKGITVYRYNSRDQVLNLESNN